MKKLFRVLRSEARGLKPRSQDNLSGWGLAGTIAGVSAGSLLVGGLTGRWTKGMFTPAPAAPPADKAE